jgi:hypothetical protein
MKNKNILLAVAAVLAFGVAVYQLAISIVPEWAAYFGAGDELVSNRLLLLAAGTGMTLIFAVCGFYALSGAGLIRRLPLLRLGLFFIGLVFIYRGIAFVLQLLAVWNVITTTETLTFPNVNTWVSLVSLVIGLVYWIGLAAGCKQLRMSSRLQYETT